MSNFMLYAMISVPIVLIFTFRASLLELYVSIPLRLSILVCVARGECRWGDLVKSHRYREMSRDWALNQFRIFLNAPQCRDFIERHAGEKHQHNAKLWRIGNTTYSLNVATGKVRVIYHQSGLVFTVTPEAAVAELYERSPLSDPYVMTMYALYTAKHAIAYHDRRPENFHETSEA